MLEGHPPPQVVHGLAHLVNHDRLCCAEESLQLVITRAGVQRDEPRSVGHLNVEHGEALLHHGLVWGTGNARDSRPKIRP